MAAAIDRSEKERMKEMGVQYVLWDASMNACEWCLEIAAKNGGYYLIEDAPDSPVHPNCKCLKGPVFNLPGNVKV